ncbi:unnamed protein product [Urochloa humidicola]
MASSNLSSLLCSGLLNLQWRMNWCHVQETSKQASDFPQILLHRREMRTTLLQKILQDRMHNSFLLASFA